MNSISNIKIRTGGDEKENISKNGNEVDQLKSEERNEWGKKKQMKGEGKKKTHL